MLFDLSFYLNVYEKVVFVVELLELNIVFFFFIRWFYGLCDGFVSEEELDRAVEYGYYCLYCRSKIKRVFVGVSGMFCRILFVF